MKKKYPNQSYQPKYLPVRHRQQHQSNNYHKQPFNQKQEPFNQSQKYQINSEQEQDQDYNQYYFQEEELCQPQQTQTRKAITSRSNGRQKNNPINENHRHNKYNTMDMMMRLQQAESFEQKQNFQNNFNNAHKQELVRMKNIQIKKEKVKQNEQKILTYRQKLEKIYQNYKKKEEIKQQAQKKIKKKEAQLPYIQENNQQLQEQIKKLKQMIKKSLLQRQKQKINGSSSITKKLNKHYRPATQNNKSFEVNTHRSNREKSQSKAKIQEN